MKQNIWLDDQLNIRTLLNKIISEGIKTLKLIVYTYLVTSNLIQEGLTFVGKK